MFKPYGCAGEHRPPEGPLAPDLTRATTFAYPSAEELRAVGAGETEGEFYIRYGHPAARRFESEVAELEAADGAVSFASGQAALHAMFCGLLNAGDTLAASRFLYGGTEALLTHDLPRLGITVRRFDPFDPADTDAALRPPVQLVHVESPSNPLCRVVDLERVAAAAHAGGALVSVDATFLPPPLQRPLRQGIDLVMHSATKMLGGHSDAHAGIVSGRHELMERLEAFRRRAGGVLAPDVAWLLSRSLATLDLRARAACENAARLAVLLEELRAVPTGSGVERVHYSGLPDHPDHAVARRQQAAFGFMLSFEARGGLAGAVAVYDRFQVIARAVSLGGVHSLASLPLHTSHAGMSAEERAAAGVADGLIRVSIGSEPYETLAADFRQALGAEEGERERQRE